MEQDGITPENNGYFFMKITHAPKMAMIVPAKYQQGIRAPRFDLLIQVGIDDPPEMSVVRPAGGILYKLIIVPFQQGEIPFDIFSKTRIIERSATCLLPGIKDFDLYTFFGKPYHPGCVVLDRMGSNNGQFFLSTHSSGCEIV